MRYVGVPLRADFSLDDRRDAGGDRARAAGARLARVPEQSDRQPVRRAATSSASLRARAGPRRRRRGLLRVRRRDASCRACSSFPNLVVLRTLSKIGMAGAAPRLRGRRIRAWIAEFDKVRPPYNVNALTQAVAPVLLAAARRARRAGGDASRRARRGSRPRWPRCPGVAVFPTQANFVLVRVPDAPRCVRGVARSAASWSRICTAWHPLLAQLPAHHGRHAGRERRAARASLCRRRMNAPDSSIAPARRAAGRAQHDGDADRASRSISTAPAAPSSRPACRSSTTCSTRSRATACSTSTVEAKGDLHIDAHHTVEDVGITLGQAVRAGARRQGGHPPLRPRVRAARRGAVARGDRPVRAARARVPRAVHARADRRVRRRPRRTSSSRASSTTRWSTLHVDNLRGDNAHHQAETVFKAFGRALRMAVERDPRAAGVDSVDQGNALATRRPSPVARDLRLSPDAR